LWVHCLYHVDTSGKWGTHVLRFFWRTYGNAYLSKNTFLPLYLGDLLHHTISSSNGTLLHPILI
jgi:hypothetical protein